MYTNTNASSNWSICRAENVKFKADITMMLTDITDWHRVEAGRGVRYAHRDIISKGRVGCI
jgi:hypothetical protein